MERYSQLQNNIQYWRHILRKDTLSLDEILSLGTHSLRESTISRPEGVLIGLPSRFPLMSFLDDQIHSLDLLLRELAEIAQKDEYPDQGMDIDVRLDQIISCRLEMIADGAREHWVDTTVRFTSHDILTRQRLPNAFPAHLREDVAVVIEFLAPVSDIYLDSDRDQKIILEGETLSIPQRISIGDTSEFHGSEIQEAILNCIYLLHHDGYIRQEKLEKLLRSGTYDYFIMPYIFKLLGEYVIEILDVLDKYLDDRMIGLCLRFISENLFYARQTEDRVISYWDVYYRGSGYYFRLKEYVGWRMFQCIKETRNILLHTNNSKNEIMKKL